MIFLITLAMACPSELLITCKAVCAQDGDEKGILLNGQCYCANKRDLTKIIVKISRDFKGHVLLPEQNDE